MKKNYHVAAHYVCYDGHTYVEATPMSGPAGAGVEDTSILLPPTGDSASICERVVEGVAEITGRPLVELPALAGVVDPDALESVFSPVQQATAIPNGTVSFEYADCLVVVRSDGTVFVERRPQSLGS